MGDDVAMRERIGVARRAISRRDFLKLGGVSLVGASLLGGCGGGDSGGSSFPDRDITAIVPYSAGGGTDTGARELQPYVEEQLGVSMNIVNRPGGSGFVGWTELANAEPNGYTVGFVVSPNLQTGYLNPEFNRDLSLGDFAPIGNQVSDYRTVAVNGDDDRFETIEDLINFARDNQPTITAPGVGSSDHLGVLQINAEHGTNFDVIQTGGSADSRTMVLGGNADVVAASVGELQSLHNDGELKILAVMSRERSEFLPDVPTFEGAGYPGVYSQSARGIAGPAGIDSERLDVLANAFGNAIQNQEHVEALAEQALQVNYLNPEDYQQLLQQDEDVASRLGQKYIWG